MFATCIQRLEVAAPAELGAAAQQCRHAGCHAEADRLAQSQAAAEAKNNTRQYAVAGPDRAPRLDRDRGEALASLCSRQQSTSDAEREDDDLTAALLEELPRGLLFLAIRADL